MSESTGFRNRCPKLTQSWTLRPGPMFGSCFIEAASSGSKKTQENVLCPLHGRLTSRPTDGDSRVFQKLGSRFSIHLQPLVPVRGI
jgi:hypothetical protein